MNELFRRVDFRPFSYEEDPESVVDMQRCRELLEGEWLDDSDTCRMHNKIVSRTPGSSWVIAFQRTILGYADLIPGPESSGCVVKWRVHPDYRHPKIVRKLYSGLLEAARKRNYGGLLFFADTDEVLADLESVGMKRDRFYSWVQSGDADPKHGSEITTIRASLEELEKETFLTFLGPPIPPRFVLVRAFLAASYKVFSFSPPTLHRIKVHDRVYTACFDGREWFVFRKERSEADKDAIVPLLGAIGSLQPRKILLSQKAAQLANLAPTSNLTLWDLFAPNLG